MIVISVSESVVVESLMMYSWCQRAVTGHARATADRAGLHPGSQLRRRQLRPTDPAGNCASAAERQEERGVRQSAEHLQVSH